MSILSTELEVYSGASGPFDGEKIGVSIIKTGSPATVTIDYEALSAYLEPGEQYSVRARCTNSDSYTTDWTSPYAFKTLIECALEDLDYEGNKVKSTLSFNYNSEVVTIASCGVYISTNASGTGATKYTAADVQDALDGFLVSMVENTNYYVIPFVIDNLNREFAPAWTEAQSITTGYNAPVVTITGITTTYDTISGQINVQSSDNISDITMSIQAAGGGTKYYFDKTAQTGVQSFTFTNGMQDSEGHTVIINPSTTYTIECTAINETGGHTTATAEATTAQQSTSTIAITSISDVGPYSAVVNLSYGDGV